METHTQRPCKVCGQPVVDTGSVMVHVGGGAVTQKCQNPSCGWVGGQAGKFTACPRCGDGTRLIDDHKAE